jgi:hypothetical protein
MRLSIAWLLAAESSRFISWRKSMRHSVIAKVKAT